MNLSWVPIHLLVIPWLLWNAATGKAPLARAGYSLMTAGLAITAFAVWVYANWTRQALPGPMDTRSQLEKSVFWLSRQAHLARVGPLWAAPIFLGAALIGFRSYQESGRWQDCIVWVLLVLFWPWITWDGWKTAKAAEARRARMEELLDDLG